MILKIGTSVLLREHQVTPTLGIGIVVDCHRDSGIEDATTTYDALFELVGSDGAVLIERVKIDELLPITVYGSNPGSIHQLNHVADHVFRIDKSLNIGEVKLNEIYISKQELLDEIDKLNRNEA